MHRRGDAQAADDAQQSGKGTNNTDDAVVGRRENVSVDDNSNESKQLDKCVADPIDSELAE